MNDSILIIVVLLMLIVFCLIGFFAQGSNFDKMRRDAVTLGYAEYNSTNGHWGWKTNSLTK